jgi:hypothetical protein
MKFHIWRHSLSANRFQDILKQKNNGRQSENSLCLPPKSLFILLILDIQCDAAAQQYGFRHALYSYIL